MTAVRIAAIALATANLTLAAQTVPAGLLNITVQDQGGARVPNAMVQIRPDVSKLPIEIRADAQGIAVLSLPSGTYTVSVIAPGFKRWRSTVDLRHGTTQAITAELLIGAPRSGFVVYEEKIIQTERQLVEATIPLEPLESLVDLPAHKLRGFRWSRHPQS